MIRYGKYTEFWRGSFLWNFYFSLSVSHIGFHKYPKLKFIFDLLYAPVAHEVLPVSLVDSVTAKVDDEEKDLAYSIYTCGIHHVVYFLNIHFIYFLYGFYMLFTYILEISQTHVRSRWRSKSGDQKSWRWSKNTFSQKCLGTFGVSFAIITGTQEQV